VQPLTVTSIYQEYLMNIIDETISNISKFMARSYARTFKAA
jgi:hypothetical protein